MITTSILIVLASTLATMITRFSPLWFTDNMKNHKTLEYFSSVLPIASFGLLVVYSLKDISLSSAPFAIPEFIAIIIIIIIQYTKENLLLSIFTGTLVYMLLVNYIF